MKKNTHGSAIIFVVLITTAFVLCVTTVWRSSFYAIALVRARTVYQQRLAAVEGVLRYGVGLYVANKDAFDDECKQGEHQLLITSVNVGDGRSYAARLFFTQNKKGVRARSVLLHDNEPVCGVHCLLVSNESITVQEWRIDRG